MDCISKQPLETATESLESLSDRTIELCGQSTVVERVHAAAHERHHPWHRSVYDDLDDGSIPIKARLPAETGRMLLRAVDLSVTGRCTIDRKDVAAETFFEGSSQGLA